MSEGITLSVLVVLMLEKSKALKAVFQDLALFHILMAQCGAYWRLLGVLVGPFGKPFGHSSHLTALVSGGIRLL